MQYGFSHNMHVATRNMHVARFFLAKWTLVLNPSDLEENYPY